MTAEEAPLLLDDPTSLESGRSSSSSHGGDDGIATGYLPPGHQPRTSVRQALIMSASFCLIFLAFSSAQNFGTSRKGNTGTTTLGIVYAVFTASNLLAAPLVRKFGPRLSLIIGSATYAGYVAANIWYTPYVMYPAGALLGVGAAVTWTAEGVYITRVSHYHEVCNALEARSTGGYFNGIFWSGFQFSQFFGNLLVALLYTEDVSTRVIFVVTSVLALCGSMLMTALRHMPHVDESRSTLDTHVPTWVEALTRPLALLSNPRMLLLVPIIIYSGLSQGFIFGEYPPLIDEKKWKFYVMAAFGLSDAFFSYVIGKYSDSIGRWPCLSVGTFVHSLVYVFLYLYDIPQHEHGTFFAGAMIWAIGDAAFNTQLYAIVGHFFEGKSEAAFACFKLFQAGMTAVTFFTHKHVGWHTKLFIMEGTLIFGMLVLLFLHRTIASIEDEKRKRGADTGGRLLHGE